MCTVAGPSEMLLIGVVVGAVLLGPAVAAAVLAWRRGGRGWSLVAAVAALVPVALVVAGEIASDDPPGGDPPGAVARAPWWGLALVTFGAASACWLARAARPVPPLRHVALGLVLGASLVLVALYLHSGATALSDCEWRMTPPTVPR